MISRKDFENYERILHKEIATRGPQGGYSPEAPTILMLCQLSFELLRHLRESLPDEPALKPIKEKSRKS